MTYSGIDGFSMIATSPSPVVTVPWVLNSAGLIYIVQGGPIHILQLITTCVTSCDASSTTLQWRWQEGIVGLGAELTGPSPDLASCAAGSVLNFTFDVGTVAGLGTPGTIATDGVFVPPSASGVIVPKGFIITLLSGAGVTTGTFRHEMRWQPLSEISDVRMPLVQEFGV